MSNDLYLNSNENSETEKLPENISEEDVLYWAEKIVTKRFTRSNYLTSPEATREFLQILLAKEHREIFIVIFLDNQNGVLGYEILFQGTIDSAAVYPREIVKAVLINNAASVILAHNHPSGTAMPSEADKRMTTRVSQALGTIDVKVLDHLVAGGVEMVSFAERGLLQSRSKAFLVVYQNIFQNTQEEKYNRSAVIHKSEGRQSNALANRQTLSTDAFVVPRSIPETNDLARVALSAKAS